MKGNMYKVTVIVAWILEQRTWIVEAFEVLQHVLCATEVDHAAGSDDRRCRIVNE